MGSVPWRAGELPQPLRLGQFWLRGRLLLVGSLNYPHLMSTDEVPPAQPEHPELLTFWEATQSYAKLNGLRAYLGPNPLEAVPPPAWSYGETSAEADEFVARVIADELTSIVTPVQAYTDAEEDLPVVGTLSILCDGSGRPRVLLVSSEVTLREEEGVPSVVETLKAVHSID